MGTQTGPTGTTGVTGATGDTGPTGDTGATGPTQLVLDGTAGVSLTTLDTAGTKSNSANTGILTTQTMWFSGYSTTSDYPVAISAAYVAPDVGGTWYAHAAGSAVATTTDATVVVYYSYTA